MFLNQNGVTFTKKVIEDLGYPAFVLCLLDSINDDRKLFNSRSKKRRGLDASSCIQPSWSSSVSINLYFISSSAIIVEQRMKLFVSHQFIVHKLSSTFVLQSCRFSPISSYNFRWHVVYQSMKFAKLLLRFSVFQSVRNSFLAGIFCCL